MSMYPPRREAGPLVRVELRRVLVGPLRDGHCETGACRDIGDGGDTSREEDARRVERAVVNANALHLHALVRVTLSGGLVPTATIRPDGGGLGVHGVSKSPGAPTSIDELLPKKVHTTRAVPTPRCK